MGSLFRPPIAQHLRLAAFKQPRLSILLSSFHQRGGRRNSTACAAECDGMLDLDDNNDYTKEREKDAALHLGLSRLSGDFGPESMMSLQRFYRPRHLPVISTGSLKLDLALGIGGLPMGRIVEIYGQEASGKTTLALHIIKEAQKLGESMGVNTENLIFSHPDSAENVLNVVDTLTKSGSLDVIVVDRVAALVPQCELDVSVGGAKGDAQSRIVTQALRKIHSSLSHSQTLIVFINQVRSSPNSGQDFGPIDEVTCGGNDLRFHVAVWLRIRRTRKLKTEDKVTGLGISVQVVKNKLAHAVKKADPGKVDLGIQFGRGLTCESEVLQLACEHGLISKEGSNYKIGQKISSSELEAKQYLANNN